MNRQQFYQYLENPQDLNEESLKHLTELVAEYPYFQVGRMLLVKNLALTGNIKYNIELKKTAAHIPDRRQLYFLVNPQPGQTKPSEAATLIAEATTLPEADIETSTKQPVVNETVVPPTVNEVQAEHVETQLAISTDNYFDVSDVIDLDDGMTIDFSRTTVRTKDVEPDVLPSADLLDYELTDSPAYSLSELQDEPFDPDTTQPFSSWLKAMRHAPAPAVAAKTQGTVINKQMQIIENFLQKGRDRITPDKTEIPELHEDISANSLQESEALMTETLANIHMKQKQYKKAIVIFEKLSLKYPEKSIYFAARIKDAERLITNP